MELARSFISEASFNLIKMFPEAASEIDNSSDTVMLA